MPQEHQNLLLETIPEERCIETYSQAPEDFTRSAGKLRLKRLAIQGFKSFAVRSQVFLNEGISAIVGPNGCGKSNIVDAIRWVLGEPNAKNLRADGMQDVLFAGAQDTSPSTLAEVTLEFEGSFPDKPLIYDAYEITRRLFRTGESEYRINQKIVRLKDIHQLFADTGIGRHAFAIFEQGKIEQMISMNHAQRRLIIEEAAGISGYKALKKQALAKWKEIDEQLEQLELSHSELMARRSHLQEQAKAALHYRSLQKEIQQLEKAQLTAQWHSLDDQLQSLTLELKCVQESKKQTFQSQNILSIALMRDTQAFETQGSLLEPSYDRMMSSQKQLVHLEAGLKSLQSQKSLLENHLQEVETDLNKHRKGLAHLENQILNEEKELASEKNRGQDPSNKAVLAQQDLLDARIQLRKIEENTTRLSADLQLLQQEISLKTRALQHHQNERDLKQRALQGQEKDHAMRAAKLKELQHDDNQYQESLAALEQTFATLQMNLVALQEALDSRNNDLEQSQTDVKNISLAYEKENIALQWIQKCVKDESGHPEASLWLKKLPIDHPLKNKVVALDELLARVEPTKLFHLRFLGSLLLVPNFEIAKTIIQNLQTEHIHHFGIIVLQVFAPDLYQKNLENWPLIGLQVIEKLGDLVRTCENFEIHHDYQQWIEIEGHWIRLDQMGIIHSQSLRESRAEQLANLEICSKNCEEQQQKLLVAKNQQQTCLNHYQSLQKEYTQLSLQHREIQNRLQEMKNLRYKTQATCEQLTLNHESKHHEIEALRRELEKSQALGKQFREEIMSLDEKKIILRDSYAPQEKELFSFREKIQRLERLWKTLDGAREAHERTLLQLSTKLDFQKKQLQTITTQLDVCEQRYRDLHQDVEKLSQAMDIEQQSIEKTRLTAQEDQGQHDELQKKQQLLAHVIQGHKKQLDDYTLQTNQAEFRMQELSNKQEKFLWQRGRYETEMQERFAIAIDLMDLPQIQPGKITEDLRKFKDEMAQLGEVNFTAIRELEELDERQGLLNVHLRDVQESKIQAMRAVATLDERCKRQFRETFQIVNEAFARNFTLLFEGGLAKLSLSSQDDEDGSGVEVYACPPGKQLKGMSLLSGGEKCLTSMALMMALFEVRPAPFCLLDEIDAPLDDANVGRFLRLLQHYSHKTQIFIITHNKKTMAAAQTLIGVSMPRHGVSKVLTMDLQTKELQVH